jgi:hypothetical protein
MPAVDTSPGAATGPGGPVVGGALEREPDEARRLDEVHRERAGGLDELARVKPLHHAHHVPVRPAHRRDVPVSPRPERGILEEQRRAPGHHLARHAESPVLVSQLPVGSVAGAHHASPDAGVAVHADRASHHAFAVQRHEEPRILAHRGEERVVRLAVVDGERVGPVPQRVLGRALDGAQAIDVGPELGRFDEDEADAHGLRVATSMRS